AHGGPIFRGYQKVIHYAGLTATPDHKVWSNNEWIDFVDAAERGAPISVTGIGGAPIREAEGYYRRGSPERKEQPTPLRNNMHRLRGDFCERLYEPYHGESRMSIMRQSEIGTKVVSAEVRGCEAKMHQSE